MLHQLINFSKEFISLSDVLVRKMFVTLMKRGESRRKQIIAQDLLHKEAWEEEFVISL